MWPELSPPPGHSVFAIVGAESTGKSTLAAALAQHLPGMTGLTTTWVTEVLREWCDAAGRTPRKHEQADIAAEQARRIAEASATHRIVVCDTTPLMTAVYHRQVFADRSLDAPALSWQSRCSLTLLTALDLPWEADGLQRDGPQARVPVDATLRELLITHALPFSVVAGQGEHRLEAALDALSAALHRLNTPGLGLLSRLHERQARLPAWPWRCEHCDSPACEHALIRLAAERARHSLQGH